MTEARPAVVLAALGLFCAAAIGVALADTGKGKPMTTAHATARPATEVVASFMPEGYREASRRAVTVDGQSAALVRYERLDGRNASAGGEHYSSVIASDGRLKGFARIDLDLVGRALPTREEAQAIAISFLRDAAPELLPGMKLSWIAPHDEPLRVVRGGKTESVTLTGMKVKMRNSADGLWM